MSGSPYVLLCQRLAALAEEVHAAHVAVVDETGHMYGFSDSPSDDDLAALGSLMDDVIASADRPLHRGGRIHYFRERHAPFAFAESFAGIYILVMRFDHPPEPVVVLKSMRALHEIERLVLSLPPDDPGVGEGAMRMRRR